MPDYRAYTVINKKEARDFWIRIGAGFQHNDGIGINVLLQAMPLDGKIVLRPINERDKTE